MVHECIPTQSLIPESEFQTYPSTTDLKPEDLTRFENESLNFGPEYTVFEPTTAVQAIGVRSSSLGVGPQPNQGGIETACNISLSSIPNSKPTSTPGLGSFNGISIYADANVAYSSSIEFLSPTLPQAQSPVPWIEIINNTGTGVGSNPLNSFSITVEYQFGYTGGGSFTTHTRTARINVFRELDDGSFVDVNYGIGCLVMQTYRIQNTGGSSGTGGGIPNIGIP